MARISGIPQYGSATVIDGPVEVISRDPGALTFTVGEPGKRVFVRMAPNELHRLLTKSKHTTIPTGRS